MTTKSSKVNNHSSMNQHLLMNPSCAENYIDSKFKLKPMEETPTDSQF